MIFRRSCEIAEAQGEGEFEFEQINIEIVVLPDIVLWYKRTKVNASKNLSFRAATI
jgi:hypothetical protein